MSAGNALPAGAPPGCRPVASPEPGRPGSCPRSSAHVMATWWSPFVDVPTGRLMPAGSKGYTCPPTTPIARSNTTRRSRSVQLIEWDCQPSSVYRHDHAVISPGVHQKRYVTCDSKLRKRQTCFQIRATGRVPEPSSQHLFPYSISACSSRSINRIIACPGATRKISRSRSTLPRSLA